LKIRSHQLFSWAGVELLSSPSQCPKNLGLQAWATASSHNFYLTEIYVERDWRNHHTYNHIRTIVIGTRNKNLSI
jgi:hypothetical protein